MSSEQKSLIIACGALAHELTAVIARNQWRHLEVQCLPAKLHNTPEKITDAVRGKILAGRDKFKNIYVAYGDCGTGGHLDRMLEQEGVQRIGGNHCYEFFAGTVDFEALAEEELGTFYLTDYLARHFDRLIIKELGIEQHPELMSMYFGHYKRVVYLAQKDDPDLIAKARSAAERLGLEFEIRYTGLEPFEGSMGQLIGEHRGTWPN